MAKAVPEPIISAGSNCLWTWNQIYLAETFTQLEQVSIDIQNDRFEGEPYTKDDAAMSILRRSYLERRKQCRKL